MKIAWVADFSIKHNIGGAQRSDFLHIQEGRNQNLSITEINYDNAFLHDLKNFDIVISANLSYLIHSNPFIVQALIKHPRHYRLEHDLNRYLTQEDRVNIFKNCIKTFFLTQYHYELFLKMYGSIFYNIEIVSDPIDTNVFYNFEQPREDLCAYVGFMHDLKGTKRFIEYVLENKDKRFVVAGWGDKVYEHCCKTIENIYFVGQLEYSDMPKFYNSYSTFFYLPVLEEPFCRSAAEALLCGMQLICNDSIGCIHETSRVGIEKFKYHCTNASKIFWEKIMS